MSDKPRYTPGPWLIDQWGGIVSPDGERILASGLSLFMSGGKDDRDLAEANSRLIAAAPDLLAACETLDSLNCCTGYSLPDADYPKLWDALCEARVALARVRGVTP